MSISEMAPRDGGRGPAKDSRLQLVPTYPRPLLDLAASINGAVSPIDRVLLAEIAATNWRRDHWDITNQADRNKAAVALAIGAPVFHQFGNFAALTFHPDIESMRTVNVAKGRKPDQVASVTTTREHIPSLFDWSKLPEGLDKDRVLGLIDAFYGEGPHDGPFGFRGPAADHIPDHLTTPYTDPVSGKVIRTVQLIAPGYRDGYSNDLLERGLEAASRRMPQGAEPLTYFAITSANISSNKTHKDEPAHYRVASRSGLKSDFGNLAPGFVILGMPNRRREEAVRSSYPHHEPNSTTILDFSRATTDANGRPTLFMARHGSLSDATTERILGQNGFGLQIDQEARPAMKLREYSLIRLPRAGQIFSIRHSRPPQQL